MAGRPTPGACRSLPVVHEVAAHAGVQERHPLLGDALASKAIGRPGRIAPVVDDRDQGDPTRFPASKNERSSWTASAEKPR